MERETTTNGHWSPLPLVLAILLAVLLLAGLGLRYWAAEREYEFTGPTHITSGAAGVFVYASGEILHLSSAGQLLDIVDSNRSLLADDPIDLVALSGDLLLVAEQQPAKIRICSVPAWDCDPLGGIAISGITRQFKVIPSATPQTWLLTDAHGDSLWTFRESPMTLNEVLPKNTLAGPNGLAFDHSGGLWVADTDHRRIMELVPRDDGTFESRREHSAMNELTVSDRHYPMMLTQGADKRLWVSQAADFSKPYADLVVYDPDDGMIANVSLPEGAYATDVTALDEDVLVTDMELFSVYRVNTFSRDVSTFGDQAFTARLQSYRDQKATYGRLGFASLAAVIGAALLLIIAAIRNTPKERRWSKRPDASGLEEAAERVPETHGIHWLEKNPKMRWMNTWFARMYYVLFVLLCAVSILLYMWSCQQPWDPADGRLSDAARLGLLLLACCLVTASFIPMIHRVAGVLRRRLGTDGQLVHIELENGHRLSARPEQLARNKRAVFYGAYVFPLQTGRQQAIYSEGEVLKWLAPLLRSAESINEWQTLKRQWKHRDGILIATLGAIIFMMIIVLLTHWLL